MAAHAATPSTSESNGSKPSSLGKLSRLDAAFAQGIGGGRDYPRSEWLGTDPQMTADESSNDSGTDDFLELLAANLRRSQ
jgi:hypothetical protein